MAFLEGDIDRPVVVGSVYNGLGQADAAHMRSWGGCRCWCWANGCNIGKFDALDWDIFCACSIRGDRHYGLGLEGQMESERYDDMDTEQIEFKLAVNN